MSKQITGTIFLCLGLILAACSKKESPDTTQRFEVVGFVESTLDERNRILVDHEEIPDFMPRMTMLFNVADPAEAQDLKVGEEVEFTFHVAAEKSWIDNIQRTGNSRSVSKTLAVDPDIRAQLLALGEPLPDYEFIDEDGKNVRLSDYHGSVVALSFIFTQCPVPEYCPAMMRNFGNVDEILENGERLKAPWKLVTLSFDPENDTPEVMKRYGQMFDYDPENWDLLTSRSIEPIEGIAANVGLKFGKKDGSYLHNLRTVVLDTKGRVHHLFTDESWTPEELARVMRSAAGN